MPSVHQKRYVPMPPNLYVLMRRTPFTHRQIPCARMRLIRFTPRTLAVQWSPLPLAHLTLRRHHLDHLMRIIEQVMRIIKQVMCAIKERMHSLLIEELIPPIIEHKMRPPIVSVKGGMLTNLSATEAMLRLLLLLLLRMLLMLLRLMPLAFPFPK